MRYYYACFKKTSQKVEVEFPDLLGCVTYGEDWEDAITNATDVLAAWLAHAEPEFIKEPSSYRELKKSGRNLVPILVDMTILQSYQELKRFNVIFPAMMLRRIDAFRNKVGLKRSTFLLKAAEEYMHHH